MELYKEILAQVLSQQKAEIVFPQLELNAVEIVETECYKALQKIKAVIDDHDLNDSECFSRIEEIVCTLEELGCSSERHDFG